MVDDDSDDMLGVRLDSALRAGLDLTRVDVETLLQGSRRRAQRVRAQRIGAAVTTAVLVVAVPVGYQILDPNAAVTAPPAMFHSNPAATVPTIQPGVTAASPVPPSESFSTRIPESFAFSRTELPTDLAFEPEAKNAGGAIVDGQVCAGARQGAQPVASRQWVWSTSPGKADNRSVSLTVTTWATGDAATAFAVATEATGNCTWKDPQTRHPLPDVSVEQSWAATSEAEGRYYGRVVIRMGDGIVGVQVQDPKSAATAAELAERLVGIQVTRLGDALKGPG